MYVLNRKFPTILKCSSSAVGCLTLLPKNVIAYGRHKIKETKCQCYVHIHVLFA